MPASSAILLIAGVPSESTGSTMMAETPPVATLHFLASVVGIDFNGHSAPNRVTLIVALTLCVSAFQAEVVKGALNSFDTGQAAAAYSLGY